MAGQMRTVVVDKIASVAQACGLSHEMRVATSDIPCEEGVVLVVRDPEQQVDLQQLELTSGRMAKVEKRRRHRRRARPPPGAVRLLGPRARDASRPGDIVQLLNIGGVLGICDSVNPDRASRSTAGCSAACCSSRSSASASACRRASATAQLDYDAPLDTHGVPVVALAGTCMNAGKTAAACAIVSRMRHRGLAVDAFKATGVSLRRDILAMEDAGARRTHDLHRPRHRHHDGQHRARRSRARC